MEAKNGLSEKLSRTVKPKVAVVSLGKDNRYGHPHKEVLSLLNNGKIKLLRTDQVGDVVIEGDGNSFWIGK